jgi:hypothetical protein
MSARPPLLVLLAALFMPATSGRAAEQAPARLFCLSLQFQAVTQEFGLQSLALSTASPGNPPNGELRPLFLANEPSHGSSFSLTDPNLGTLTGQLAFDVPPVPDTTGDGFSDFFKTSQAVPTTTTAGRYTTEVGVFSGSVSAVWNRSAGSASGTCAVTLTDDTFGQLETFKMPFELLEYQGTFAYSGGATNVDATIGLTQSPNLAGAIFGPLEFFRSPTNSLNQILLQPGVWTNNLGQLLSYTNGVIVRDSNAPTNYYGTLVFQDGDPSTPDPDYPYWEISIKDPNDSNGNGIPDLTDPTAQAPSPPQLALASTPSGLILTLSAPLGSNVAIQTSTTLGPAAWATSVTLTMTNSVETFPVSVSGSPQFWRAALLY